MNTTVDGASDHEKVTEARRKLEIGDWAGAASIWNEMPSRAGELSSEMKAEAELCQRAGLAENHFRANSWKRALPAMLELTAQLGGAARELALARSSICMRKQDRADEAQALLSPHLHDQATVALLTEWAELATVRKDFAQAVTRWRRVLQQSGRNATSGSFTRYVYTLRLSGRVQDAEVAADIGVALYPNHGPLLSEYAEIAMTRQAWSDAKKRWESLLDHPTAAKSATIYSRLGRALRNAGELDEADRCLEKGMREMPDEVASYKEALELALARQQWALAVERGEAIISRFASQTPRQVHLILAQAHIKLGQYAQSRARLRATADPATLKAELSYEALRTGNVTEAVKTFNDLIGAEEFSDSRQIWKDTFHNFSHLFASNGTAISNLIAMPAERPAIKKIIVSGMGWSGSGALEAYFKEFDEVLSIEGEFMHIEGPSGLRKVYAALEDREAFKASMLELFRICLFGYGVCENRHQVKGSGYARRFVHGENAHQYAFAVGHLIWKIVEQYLAGQLSKGCFRDISGDFVDLMLYRPDSGKSVYLLDNVVHIANAELVVFLKDARLFCTFRDPRSNFVALSQENSIFASSTTEFVEGYRKTRLTFSKKMTDNPEAAALVSVVPFERFVLNESFREELAGLAGLDMAKQNRFRSFQPSISSKNASNYLQFAKQEAIQQIAKELPEYLVDLEAQASYRPA